MSSDLYLMYRILIFVRRSPGTMRVKGRVYGHFYGRLEHRWTSPLPSLSTLRFDGKIPSGSLWSLVYQVLELNLTNPCIGTIKHYGTFYSIDLQST